MNKNIVLFDANCKLCSNTVQLITRYDSRMRFCFLPIDSEKASELVRLYNVHITVKGTIILFSNGKIYYKSDAVMMILRSMDGLWPLLYSLIIIPRFIRDPVYEIVAKYRYKLFGPCIDCPEYRPCREVF